jgi:hypothetical protein
MKARVIVILCAALALLCLPASARLDDDKYKELISEAKKSLTRDQYAALNAVKKLAEDNSERAAKFVLDLAVSSKTPPMVYEQCLETLRSFTSAEAVEYIAGRASGKTSERMVAADVLAKSPGEKALEALIKLTEDKDEVVARLAARSLGRRGDAAAADALIALLEKTQKEHGLAWEAALTALRTLAGTDESGPWVAHDWQDFWAAKRRSEQWAGPQDKSGGDGPHTELPEFFGAKVVSRNIIFVMDLSSSMLQSDSGGQRLARMKQELCATIDKLDQETQFNIVGFNSKLFPWKTKLAPAADANKSSAKDFVNKMAAIAYTNTDDALKTAFTDKSMDTIFLLSDGVPLRREHGDNISDAFVQGILDWVSYTNRFRRVVIHTFGFEAIGREPGGERCVDFLKSLAEKNDGEFHNIK